MNQKLDFTKFLIHQAGYDVKGKVVETALYLSPTARRCFEHIKEQWQLRKVSQKIPQDSDAIGAVKQWKLSFLKYVKQMVAYAIMLCQLFIIKSYMKKLILHMKYLFSILWKVCFRVLSRYWRRIKAPPDCWKLEKPPDMMSGNIVFSNKKGEGVMMKQAKQSMRRIAWLDFMRRCSACVLAIFMMMTLVPSNLVIVKAAVGSTALPSGYTTDRNGVMAYKILNNQLTSSTIDIKGKVNGYWLQTTYGNYGYQANISGTGVTLFTSEPSFINDGRYLKLIYTVKNTSNATASYSLSVNSDIMIGDDDTATVTKFSDNSGFKMVNTHSSNASYGKNAQFNFYGKSVYGVETPVDSYWFGYYYDRFSNLYNSVSSSQLSGTDSGMACAWKNKSLTPGASQMYSVIIGIGEANTPPKVTEVIVPNADEPFTPGKDVEITVPIPDISASDAKDMKLYYTLLKKSDNSVIQEPKQITNVDYSDVEGTMRNFVAKFTLPENMPSGDFILKVYAMNKQGGVSAEISKTLTAAAVPPVIKDISGTQTVALGSTPTPLSVTATASGSSKLSYQWQTLEGTTYKDISGAQSATYTPATTTLGTTTYRCVVSYQNDSTAKINSSPVNVTVTKASSITSLEAKVNTGPTMTLSATVKANGKNVTSGTVTFTDASKQLGTASVVNGVATLTINTKDLQTGTYTLKASYAGNDTTYSSVSNVVSQQVQLVKQIIYDLVHVSATITQLPSTYKEGSETELGSPTNIDENYEFGGWMNDAGEMITKISSTMRGNMNLIANWINLNYNVTIETNLNREAIVQKSIAGKTFTYTAVEQENYNFSRWQSNDVNISDKTNRVVSFTMPKQSVEVQAIYAAKTYQITYENTEGAGNSNPASYTYGQGFQLIELSKDGKVFDGWYDKDGNVVTEITDTTSQDLTLYAKWTTLRSVKVVNGVNNQESTVTTGVGSEVTIPVTSMNGFDFTGWEVISGSLKLTDEQKQSSLLTFIMPDQDLVVKAKYEAKEYKITYQSDGGINPSGSKETYHYGESYTLPIPVKTGYTFKGWYYGDNKISAIADTMMSDVTLNAKWEKNAYLVSATDAKINGNASSSTISYGSTVTITPIEKTGYVFKNWSTTGIDADSITNNTFTMPDQPVTIQAVYEKQRYRITYDERSVKGADLSDTKKFPTSYVYGYETVLANPTLTGYQFGGWYTDQACTQPITKIESTDASDVTLYAKYNTNNYTLSVIEGTVNEKTLDTIAYGTDVTIVAKEKAGYTFKEWKLTGMDAGSITNNTFTMPASNVVAQAMYTPNTYTISYQNGADSNGNSLTSITNPDSTKTSYTFGDSYTFQYPTADGFTFDGWVDTSGKKITTITPDSLGNLELTATWVPKTFSITYEGIAGASNSNALNGKAVDVSAGEQTMGLAQPVKVGYDFLGWTTQQSSLGITGDTLTIPAQWTDDITLTATWTAKSYSYTNQGEPKTVTLDAPQIVVEAKAKTGQRFKNWTVESGSIPVSFEHAANATTTVTFTSEMARQLTDGGTLAILAEYENEDYSILYDFSELTKLNASAVIINNNPATYTYGTGITSFANPSSVGYEFTGWNKPSIGATETGNITLSSTWKAIVYDVSAEDGTVSANTASVGQSVNVTAKDKAGYEFTGWSIEEGDVTFADSSAQSTSFVMTAGNVKLKANYVTKELHITYQNSDGTTLVTDNPSSFTVASDTITLKDASLDGYNFLGWYDNANFSGTKITEIKQGTTSDQQLYAKFEVIKDSIQVEVKGQGSCTLTNNGNPVSVDDIINGMYSTNRYSNVQVSCTPAEGYEIVKVWIDGEEIDATNSYRFDNLLGNHTITFVLQGKPAVVKPDTGNTGITFEEWDETTTTPSTSVTRKPDVELVIPAPIQGLASSYQVVAPGQAPQEGAWLTRPEDGKVTISKEGSYVVYIKTVDTAGNTTIISSNVMIVDGTAPTLQGLKDGETIYTDKNFTIEDTSDCIVTVNGKQISNYTLRGNVDAEYTIKIVDAAGNVTELKVYAKSLSTYINELLGDITKDNVTSEDAETLALAVEKLTALLDSDGVSEQQKIISDQIKELQAMQVLLGDTSEAIAKVEAGVSLEHKASNKNAIDEVIELANTLLESGNLNADEQEKLETLLPQLKEKQEIIHVLGSMEALQDKTSDNVLLADKEKLDEIIEAIDKIKDSELLTEDEKSALKDALSDYNAMVTILDTVKKKLDEVSDYLQQHDLSTTTKTEDLESIKATVNELLEELGSHLSEEQKDRITSTKQEIETAETTIKEIEQCLEEAVQALKDKDKETVKKEDQTALDQVKDSIDFIEQNKDHLDQSLNDSFEEVKENQKELNDRLEELVKEEEALEASKPKDPIHTGNVTDYEEYGKQLDEFINHFEGNVSKEELDDKTKEKETIQDKVDIVKDLKEKVEELKKELENTDISTSTKVEELDKIKELLDNITTEENKEYLNSEEIKDLDTIQKEVANVEETIKEIEQRLEDATQALKDKDKETVKKEDQTALDQVKDGLQFVENNQNHLDESLLDCFEVSKDLHQELQGQLEALVKDEAALEAAKPKQELQKSNLAEYEHYFALLQQFIITYKGNLKTAELVNLTKEQSTCEAVIKEYQHKNSTTILKHELVEITAKGSLVFKEGTKIQVELIDQNIQKSFYATVQKKLAAGYELKDIYDITIALDGEHIVIDQSVEVRIKLSKEQLAYKGIGIIYIAEDGSMIELPCSVKDGYVVFETTHFSKYAIIAKTEIVDEEEIIKDTASFMEHQADTAAFMLCLAAIVLLKRRKA